MDQVRELFPEEEPEWWKAAKEKHRRETGGSMSNSNHSTSTLSGWQEVVDNETGTVSMQRVRGGADPAVGCARSLSCVALRVGSGSAAVIIQGIRDGWEPWEVEGGEDEWVGSGQRRLNAPDSDFSIYLLEGATVPSSVRATVGGGGLRKTLLVNFSQKSTAY